MQRTIIFLLLAILTLSCTNTKTSEEIRFLEAGIKSAKKLNPENSTNSKLQIATFLTFQKEDAEAAMNFYMGLFDNSKVVNIKRWGKQGPGKEGTIMHATFTLNGNLYMCSDSPPIHEWDFTPAVSNFVECTDENQLQDLFTNLSQGGKVMMPINNYGFSQKFGFVEDRFGVSWQLNLE